MIPLAVPVIEADDLEAVKEALLSGQLVQGPRVAAFEEAIAERVGVVYAVAMSSGTAALHASLLALGVRAGDLVLVPAYSFVATANVVELCGAEPVFIDVRRDTFNMDPERLEETLNRIMALSETRRRVKAIIPVHEFGQLADMEAILDLAAHYELPVVEDAACALGATFRDRQAGTWGTIGCYSFHPRKTITTAEGGVAVTNDEGLARQLRALRNHGQDPEALSREYIVPGLNYRLSEIQASLGLSQLRKLDRLIETRQRLATHYDGFCVEMGLQPPARAPLSEPIFQSYVAVLPTDVSCVSAQFVGLVRGRGVEVTLAASHLPLASYFSRRYGYRVGDFPAADWVHGRALSLPMYEGLTPQDQQTVLATVRGALNELAGALSRQ